MKDVTFITGNQNKANYLFRLLGFPLKHARLDLDEIQSLDLKEIVEHKARQGYEKVKTPVIVEDVSLEFMAYGRLPGTFIKFFIEEVPLEIICSMLNGKTRKSTARCVFGYFDGKDYTGFESELEGEIAETPSGEKGFGWDRIFIPKGYSNTRASLSEEDNDKTYLQIKPIAQLKTFLISKV
jgi:non-canonical purine NTP pyrophosphatase (RdgB/HAM1 family)